MKGKQKGKRASMLLAVIAAMAVLTSLPLAGWAAPQNASGANTASTSQGQAGLNATATAGHGTLKPSGAKQASIDEQKYREQLAEHQRQKQDFYWRNREVQKSKAEGQQLLNMTAFGTQLFEFPPPEGLYNVDIGMSELNDFGQLQVFADMNSDKYTDIVAVNGGNQVFVHTYDRAVKMFKPWKDFVVDSCSEIRSITVGRSTQLMRIFVTCSSSHGTLIKLVDRIPAANLTKSGEADYTFKTLPYALKIETESQPFIGDLNGDFLDDIMYNEAGHTSQILVAYQIPQENANDTPMFYTAPFETALLMRNPEEGSITKQIENKRLTVPHSIGMVDFDGDCMADLFVTIQDLTTGKKFYEIYLRREVSESVEIKRTTVRSVDLGGQTTSQQNEYIYELTGLGSFSLVTRDEVPNMIKNMLNFADIDRDGMVDMFYVNRQVDASGINLVVHYNALKNADTGRDRTKLTGVEDALRTISNVCSATDRPIEALKDIYLAPSEIANLPLDKTGVPDTDRVVTMTLFPRETTVQSLKAVDLTHMPSRVSIGDISADGFPDIMLTVHYENGTDRAHVLLNSPCQKSVCGEAARHSRRRMFKASTEGVEKFIADDGDLDESIMSSVFEGHLDRLRDTDSGDDFRLMGEEFSSILSGVNNVMYAVFFDLMEDSTIDILLVTDQTLAGSAGAQRTALQAIFNNIDMSNFFLKVRMISDESIASHIPSAAMRCVVTLLNDKKIVVSGGATGQGAFHGLQTPFTFIGMGRSNNFIEEFSIAVYSGGKRSMRTWTPVIPKSILFVIAEMTENAENWNLELLLNPTDKVPLVLIADGVFLLALGLVIIVFHLYEKAEDDREKQSIQAFNYF